MTEEQFWRSNPAIIKVYEKAWKMEQNRKNELIHTMIGNYGISALCYAIDHCLNGKKAKTKYLKKPIRLFELTEEEKKIAQKEALKAYERWEENFIKSFQKNK